jgi:predicted membrane protein
LVRTLSLPLSLFAVCYEDMDLEIIFFRLYTRTVRIFTRVATPRVARLLEIVALLNALFMLFLMIYFHNKFVGQVCLFKKEREGKKEKKKRKKRKEKEKITIKPLSHILLFRSSMHYSRIASESSFLQKLTKTRRSSK